MAKCLCTSDLSENIHIHYNVKLNNTFNVGVLGSSPRGLLKIKQLDESLTAFSL